MMNENQIISKRLKNKAPARLRKNKTPERSSLLRSSSNNNTLSNSNRMNQTSYTNSLKKSSSKPTLSKSMSNKSTQISRKIYFIDELVQLNKKVYFQQNDTLKLLKDIAGRKKNLTWNIENMCKKGDFEAYNTRLENYSRFLKDKVYSVRRIVESVSDKSNLKSQNISLKNNLDLASNLGNEKRDFFCRKLEQYKSSFSNQSISVNDLMNDMFPNLTDNFHLDTFTEDTVPQFFSKLKQNLAIISQSLEDKDNLITHQMREKAAIVNEISYWKARLQDQEKRNRATSPNSSQGFGISSRSKKENQSSKETSSNDRNNRFTYNSSNLKAF